MFNVLAALGFRDKYIPYPYGAGEPVIIDSLSRLGEQMSALTPNYTHEEQFVMNKATDHKQIMLEDMTKREIQLEQRRAILVEVINKANAELNDVMATLSITRNAIKSLNSDMPKEVTEKINEEVLKDHRDTIRNATASNSPY